MRTESSAWRNEEIAPRGRDVSEGTGRRNFMFYMAQKIAFLAQENTGAP
jgi:hypothetical protein